MAQAAIPSDVQDIVDNPREQLQVGLKAWIDIADDVARANFDHRLDRAELRGIALRELPEALLDQALEIASWNPPTSWRLAAGAPDEPRRDVIAVLGALLGGMGRCHPRPGFIVDQAGKQHLGRAGTGRAIEPIGPELALNRPRAFHR